MSKNLGSVHKILKEEELVSKFSDFVKSITEHKNENFLTNKDWLDGSL